MPPRFFNSAADWREWLAVHHASETELLVGLRKRSSGPPGMTWSESVDEALCFGWIDAVRGGLDETTYSIRFTARKSGSIWSNVNIAKAEALIAAGKMTEAGLTKYRKRKAGKSGIYSYEQGAAELDPAATAKFQKDLAAWEYFLAQAPSYRKKVIWSILRARQPATREARLTRLIEASRQRRRL